MRKTEVQYSEVDFWVAHLFRKSLEISILYSTLQVLFGTDYPFLLGDLKGGDWISDSKLFSQDQKNRIFSTNFDRFLGLV